MLKELEQLLVLQERDRKIRALRQELKTAPLEKKQFDDKLAAAQQKLEATKQKGRELEVERKKLEIEVQSKRDQIAKYQTAKFQTRKNDEFQAMNTAIEHLQAEISVLEDKELELMEGVDKLRPQIQQEETELAATKKLVEQQNADLRTKTAAVEQQLKEVEGVREKLAADVDEDLLDQYQRLFANKGSAVVPLEGETCAGCHMKVTASTVARTKAGREVVTCEQCSRILYREI